MTAGGTGEALTKRWRHRELMLFALPLVSFGAEFLLPVGFAGQKLYGWRYVVPALAVWAVTSRWRTLHGLPPVAKSVMRTWLLMAGWVFLSLAWTPSLGDSVTDWMPYLLNLCAVAGVIALGAPVGESALRALRNGWVLALVLAVAIPFGELATHRHFAGVILRIPGYLTIHPLTTWATLYNPNQLAVFSVIAIPFALWWAEDGPKSRWIAVTAPILGALVICTLNSARAGMVAIPLTVLCFQWDRTRRGSRRLTIAFAVAAVAVALTLAFAFEYVKAIADLGQEVEAGGSAGQRILALYVTRDVVLSTWGIGAGAGGGLVSFRARTLEYGLTFGLGMPHNPVIEVLLLYGIPGVAMLCWAFSRTLFGVALRRRPWMSPEVRRVRRALTAILCPFVLVATGAGSVYSTPHFGCLAASVVAMMMWAETGGGRRCPKQAFLRREPAPATHPPEGASEA